MFVFSLCSNVQVELSEKIMMHITMGIILLWSRLGSKEVQLHEKNKMYEAVSAITISVSLIECIFFVKQKKIIGATVE